MFIAQSKTKFYEFFGDQQWLYRLISHFYHRFHDFKLGHLFDLRLATFSPTKTVRFRSGELNLVGDFYQPPSQNLGQTLILLHGSSVFGRKLSLMRSLAGEFQRLGYAVFVFDLRGYGESDDPQTYTPESFDYAQDVQAAIDWISTEYPEHAQQFHLLGHSFGGAVALAAQARDSRVTKIVSFGPPRRLSERFLNPEAREKKKLLVRWQADMQLPQSLSFCLWAKVLQPLNIENYVEAFSQPDHTPVFLIDAAQEPPADLAFLHNLYRQIKPPAAYWTVPGTDHYLGTGFLLGLPCYNRRVLQAFVQRVTQWLQSS